LFPELRRGGDETYRRCEFVTLNFDLETGAQCSTCRRVPSWQLWLFVIDLWAIGRGRASVGGARHKNRYRSIDRL